MAEPDEDGEVRQVTRRRVPLSADRRRQCPSCGEPVPDGEMAKSAEWFCTACDYPLFWATTAWVIEDLGDVDVTVDGGLDPALRRRPGTEGMIAYGGRSCPSCAELNDPGHDFCTRCGSPMVLVAETATVQEVTPAMVEVGPEQPRFPLALVLGIVVVIILLLVVVVALVTV